MSVQDEINRLNMAKADIKSAIEGKGVNVPDTAQIDEMAGLIRDINSSGATNLLDGSRTKGSLRSIYSAEESDEYILAPNAVALGANTKASGDGAFACGSSNVSSGMQSHSEGYGCTASGYAAHAEGVSTTASGYVSHAEGSGSIAMGKYAHAENASTAVGDFSHSEGDGTYVRGYCQHVQGKNNIRDVDGKYAHIVGNGEDISNPSNAHTLDWEGNAWYQGRIKIGGTGWDDATDEVAYKSDLEGLGGGGGVSDNDILAALIETDSLPAITNLAGAILTDTQGNIILRY